MKVGFINTSGKQNFKPFRIDPLSSLFLLTILEKEFGDKLDLSYTDLRGVNEDSAVHHIPEKNLYLHYVTTPDFPEIVKNIQQIKKFYPGAKHIAGGPHVNIFPDDSLKIFDAICLGEGEETIKKIITDAMNANLQKIYKQEKPVDINQYPYPSRKYLPKAAIVDTNLLSRKHSELLGTSVLFSRGCPYNCHFCSNMIKGAIRYRAPELITAEIEYLKKEYKIEALLVKDDNGIPVQKKFAQAGLEAIARADIKWRGQTRANGVHPDMIRLAQESGCVELAVAIESVSQKALDIMNKKINLIKAKEYLKLLKKEKIDIKLLLILGLPGEPDDIAQKTINFIEEVEPTNVSLSILCPIPGSELYKNPKKFGIKINYDIPFDKYFFAFGRFDEDEKPPRLFEYDKETPFGRGMSIDEIKANHKMVQGYLREHNLNY